MGKALIIVDVQPTFCEGGELGMEGGNAVAERIAEYVESHRGEYAYIATTQDWHIEPGTHWSDNPDYVDTWPVHGKAGTANAELHPAIAALKITHHFKKGQYSPSYSGFEGSEDNTDRIPTRTEVDADLAAGKTLANALRAAGVTRVDVVGLAESHCVTETACSTKSIPSRQWAGESRSKEKRNPLYVADSCAEGIVLRYMWQIFRKASC